MLNEHYILLSELHKYPDEGYKAKVQACQLMLEQKYPDAAAEMKPFTEYISNCTLDQQQELFTKTFDVQPICYLDLGYVIFGEDYKRGTFLVNMQKEQSLIGNDCGTELSDHIGNILTFMAKSDNTDFKTELVYRIVIPALEKMIAEFESARVALKLKVLKKLHRAIIQEELNQGNVYKNSFAALKMVIEKDFENLELPAVEDAIKDPTYHRTFFKRNSVNQEVNQIFNNYKLD